MKDIDIWKIYPLNFESSGLLVSNFGRIKRFDWEDRSISDNGAGYKKAAIHNLSKDKKFKMKNLYLHRIVAELFLPNPLEHQTQINHIDGDKSNNYVNNLEWISPKENIKHSHKLGLSRGRRDHGTTITLSDAVIEQAYLDVKLHGCGVRVTAERHGMPRTTLSSILNKRSRVWITDVLDEEFKLTEKQNV